MDGSDALIISVFVCGLPLLYSIAWFVQGRAANAAGQLVELEVEKLLNTLPKENQAAFMHQYNDQKKKPSTAVALAFFLGGFGLHKFYLGQKTLGSLYLLFCLTSIPSILGILEALTIGKTVHKYNLNLAHECANMFRSSAYAFPMG